MGYVKIRAVRVVQNITENLATKSILTWVSPTRNSGQFYRKICEFFDSFDTEIIPILYQ